MPTSSRELPQNPNLEQYKKQAKELVKAHAAGERSAAERIRTALPRAAKAAPEQVLEQRFALSEAQLVIAREHGFPSWARMKERIAAIRAEHGDAEAQVETFVLQVEAGDASALRQTFERFPALRRKIGDPLFEFGRPAIVAARDRREVVDLLLELGADINARSHWERGSYGVLDDTTPENAAYLIERGAYVDIHAAASLGRLGRVEELLEGDRGLVHRRGPDGKLPLHCAATPEIVDLLLDHGADIDARDVDHVATAAQYAVRRPAVCRRLIERGAELDVFMAAALGDVALIDRALAAAPETLAAHAPCMLDEQSEESGYFYPKPPEESAHIYTWALGFGWSPAFTALQLGHPQAYEYLLSLSSPMDRLAEACARKDVGAVEELSKAYAAEPRVLSEKKADLVAGRSAFLRHLGDPEGVLASVRLFLKAGFDPGARCYWGLTGLQWAAWFGHAGVVDLLLKAGATVQVVKGRAIEGTPIGAAVHGCFFDHPDFGEYLEVFRLLIAAGDVVKPEWLPTKDAVVDRVLAAGLPPRKS
jgi:ankyrin repeat protein